MSKKLASGDDFVTKLLAWEESCTVPINGLPKKVSVIGIDPGISNLALCHITGELWVTQKLSSEPLKTMGARVRWLEEQVTAWVDTHKPHLLVKEGMAYGKVQKAGDLGRVQYALERIAIEKNIPLVTVAPMSAKAFIGASKKDGSNKDAVQLQLYKKYGISFRTSDEADSYLLAQTGLAIATGAYVVGAKPTKKKTKKAT